MKNKWCLNKLRLVLFLGLFSFGIIVNANPCDEGFGGTGHGTDPEGFGGTGNSTETQGFGGTGHGTSTEGFGGTGISADNQDYKGTNIVGVITGFASICVNGIEAHFDDNTKVDVNGVSSSITHLNKGQLVAIEATGLGDQVQAKHVSVIHAIVGKVEAISPAKNQIKIMGQLVQLNQHTQNAGNYSKNQTIAVSGYFGNSAIQATRTDLVNNDSPSMITGKLKNGMISGIPVKISHKTIGTDNVQVSGRWDGHKLNVQEIKPSAIDRVMREGFVFNIQTSLHGLKGQPQVLGKQIKIDKNTTVHGNQNAKGSIVTIQGVIEKSGRAVATDIKYQSIEKVLERSHGKEFPTDMPKSSRENILKQEKSVPNDSETHNQMEKHENAEHSEIRHKQEKIERSERIERHEKVEVPERVEVPEKVEIPERVEVPEKVEIPERVEVPEKVEKPENDD